MSVESTEREALQKKDREELTQIIDALGGKVTSRTRKADMVQTILELTGVDTAEASDAQASAGSEAGQSEQASSTNGSKAPAAAVEAAGEVRSGEAGSQEDESSDGAGAEGRSDAAESAESRADEAESRADGADPAESKAGESKSSGETEVTEVSGEETAAGEDKAAEEGEEDDRKTRKASGKDRQDTDSDADRAQKDERSQAKGDGGGEAQSKEGDGEQGNRRRRRRGRNRSQESEDFSGEPVPVAGILDMRNEGYGFLRVKGYLPSKEDCYVSVKQVRQFGLRAGDRLEGASRPAFRNEKNPALLRIDTVNGVDPEQARKRPKFENLTPLFPDEKLRLEQADDPTNMTARIVDLISPIGKGQRGMIVSPPKAGKTTVMKQIARSIERNNPEVHLMILLVDERPEEVTDMKRSVESAEVVSSTFDRPSDEHTQVAELASARAMRLVEEGRDVVIILDGITRLARAYNMSGPASGRLMSGGMDSAALYPPKRFFGAARNLEEGGSLTILATALVETGSKMDEVIFEEFKGTGNMELRLDRRLSERRIYPSIDVDASSTRHEELLFPRGQLNQVWKLRRVLSGLANSGEGGNSGAGLELLIDRMKTFKSNDEFLAEIARAPSM